MVQATPTELLPRRERRKIAKFTKKAVALTLTGLLLGGGYFTASETLAPSTQAQALSYGPGMGDRVYTFAGGYLHANGTVLYCLELGKLPDDTNSAPALNAMSTIPGYTTTFVVTGGQQFNGVGAGAISESSSQYKRMAYLLGKYGQTQNDQQAAALAIAIWQIRGEVGKTGDYDALLNAERGFAGAAASNQANQMLTEASNWLAAGGSTPGESTDPAGEPVLQHTSAYAGTVTVKKGTTEVNLTNAVFEDGSSSKSWPDGLGQDTVLNWVGKPPTDDEFGRYYRVSVSGETSWTTSTQTDGKIYATQGDALNQSTGYAQPGESKTETHKKPFEGSYIDPDTLWAPQLTTEVPSEFVKKGERFSDTVTFFASTDEPYGGWRKAFRSNGEEVFAPITAKGTLYGPFAVDPALNPQGTPPAGAPVAAKAEITTDVNKGPGTYEVTSEVAKESGYYTWVWDINYDDQASSVIAPPNGEDPSIPDNYFFTDGFGQATEGQTVPTTIEFSTELSEEKVKMGGTLTDEIDIELVDGLWLRGEDGNRLPFTLEGTVYTSKDKPVQQSQAPEDARKISTLTITVDDTGKVISDEFTAPVTDHNWLTVQWCVDGDSQPGESKGKVEDYCDDYGVPSETAKIEKPKVTTQAQEEGAVYGKIKDTAFVEGAMPDDLPAEVDFTAYLKPEVGQPKYDENWNKVLDENGDVVLWTEDEVSNPEAVCEAQPVAKTDRVEVTGVGEYDSPEVMTKSDGTVYWVEELFVEDPETGDNVSVHRGLCGLPNETTHINPPTVTTQAQEVGAVKGDIHDIAFVEGLTPDAPTSVDFTLFLKPEVGQPKYDENWNEVLDENGDVVLWTEDEVSDPAAVCEAQPVAKTDRVEVDGAGEYTSPAVRAETEGTAYWVEELFVEDPETGEETSLHRGECGLPNETTVIERPKVTTKAVPEANVGQEIFDTAIVEGPLSDREEISYEVTFEAYHRAEGTTTEIDEKLCTPDTKVWESDKATPVSTEGEYVSETWTVKEKHVGEILWVETLTEIEKVDGGEIRTEIHRGACGEENEITKVNKPEEQLAFTGGGTSVMAFTGLGALVIAMGVTLMVARRRESELV